MEDRLSCSAEHLRSDVDLYGVLEGVHDPAGHGGDAAEDVDDGFLHAFFRLELKILVFELHGDVG